MEHLTQRVAWHDNAWDATVCQSPADNSFCVMLDEVRKRRDDELEIELAGRSWADLDDTQLPPCSAQAAGFMNGQEWRRLIRHPYEEIKAAHATHGHLRPTSVPVPPFSFFAVPYWWMLRGNSEAVNQACGELLPADEEPPFSSAWVFGRDRQRAINDSFFGRLTPGSSLSTTELLPLARPRKSTASSAGGRSSLCTGP